MVVAGLASTPDQRRNAELAPNLRAGLARDQRIVAPRQLAFGLPRITLVERPRDHHSQHAVAEEFEALVAFATDAGVRQRKGEQRRVNGLMAQPAARKGLNTAHSVSPL